MRRTDWARRPGRSSSFVRKSLRYAIYFRDGFDCIYCRKVFPLRLDGEGLSLDHVLPRSRGGKSQADNLVTVCCRCNSRKQAKVMHDWLNAVQRRRVARALSRPIDRRVGRLIVQLIRAKG